VVETPIAEVDLESLREKLRDELRHLSGVEALDPYAPPGNPPPADPAPCDPPADSPSAVEQDQLPGLWKVSYKEIAQESGQHFIEKAYQLLLHRPPDPAGMSFYGNALRSGKMSKAEVLAHLRFSLEGRTRGVRLTGLWGPLLAAALRKIPVLGRMFPSADQVQTWIAEERHTLQGCLENHVARAVDELRREWTGFLKDVVVPRLEALEGRTEAMQDQTLHALKRLDALHNDTHNALKGLDERLQTLLAKDLPGHLREHAQAIALLRQAVADQQRLAGPWLRGQDEAMQTPFTAPPTPPDRMASWEASTAGSVPPAVDPHNSASTHVPTSSAPFDPHLDALYTALEDAFRGTSEAIQERLRFYLPYVRTLPLDLAPVPLVDAGCGRGEWLHLLRQEGIAAVGVDTNPLMVARCREQGLHVLHSDVVSYLRSVAPGSVGAITAFQLIEHLDLSDLVAFLDAAYESLVPGGMLLCETPNPENLMVSAYYFHFDPTHRRPIPPPVARFLLESRGFACVEVVRPPGSGGEVPSDAATWHPLLQKALFAAADYAVIARKAPCDHSL